jgi:hypothetical protein
MSSLGVTAYYYSPNEVNIHYNVDNTVTTANAQSNNTDLLAYQTVQCPVIFDQSFQLYVALVGQGGGVVRTFELFTADYRERLATSTSTSYVFAGNINAGSVYIIQFYSDADFGTPAEYVLANLQAQQIVRVSSFFTNGFELNPSISPLIDYTYGVDGEVTFTFTNFPLTIGQEIYLGNFEVAIRDGTATVLSSDTAVFNSYTQSFTLDQSLAFVMLSKVAGTFTGTVTISCILVGTTETVPLRPIKSNFVFPAPVFQLRTFAEPEPVEVQRKLAITAEAQPKLAISSTNVSMGDLTTIEPKSKIMRIY